MHPDDLREWADERPFRAFRLHLTGGLKFDIRHPEQLMVTRLSARVGSGEPYPKRDFIVALRHITHLEPVD